jgi:hypothetical protein
MVQVFLLHESWQQILRLFEHRYLKLREGMHFVDPERQSDQMGFGNELYEKNQLRASV